MSNKTEAAGTPPASSRTSTVLSLLRQDGGATLDELVQATSWQPHSARAFLSGLKRKGHVLERVKVDGTSRYRIASEVGQ